MLRRERPMPWKARRMRIIRGSGQLKETRGMPRLLKHWLDMWTEGGAAGAAINMHEHKESANTRKPLFRYNIMCMYTYR